MASKEGKAVAAAAVAAPDAALEDDEFEEFPKEGAYQSWTMPSQLGRERDAGKHRKNGWLTLRLGLNSWVENEAVL